MTTLKRLFKSLLAEKKRISFGILFTVLMALVEVFTGSMFKLITNSIVKLTKDGSVGALPDIPIRIKLPLPIINSKIKLLKTTLSGPEEIFKGLLVLTLIFVTIYLLKNLFRYLREIYMNTATQAVLRNFKREIYKTVSMLPYSFFKKNKTGDLVSRVTWDVNMLEKVVHLLIEFTRSFIYLIVLVPIMFWINWKLALFTALFFPFSVWIINLFAKKIKKTSKNITDNVGDYTAFMEERINRFSTIKVFEKEEEEKALFNKLVDENFQFWKKIIKFKYILKPSNEFIGMLGVGIVFLFFSYQFTHGGAQDLGDVAFFLYLMSNSFKPFKKVAEAIGELQIALVSSGKIFDLLDETLEEEHSTTTVLINSVEKIVGENLSFKYEEDLPVFSDFSFSAEKGSVVAVTGSSGSGKTTLINLILKLFSPDSGSIKINDSDFSAAQIRKTVAVASDDFPLFPGSLKDNLLYGSENEDSEIDPYLPFLGFEKDDLNMKIGNEGRQLSAGQSQRINLVRALLRNPKILLVDELLDTLDKESVEAFFKHIKGIDIVFVVTRNDKVISFSDREIALN